MTPSPVRNRHASTLQLAVLFAATLMPATATATAAPLDTFVIRVGGFATRFDTTIRRAEDPGDRLDFNDDLGLEDQKLIESIAVAWRPWRHHEFGVEYFDEELSGTRRLDRELELEEETFPLATTVSSTFGLEALEFHYTWWAAVHERWAVGLRVGYVDYSMRLRIRMLLGEQGEPPEVRVQATWDDHVPAPTIGVDFRMVPAERWRIGGNLGWFEAEFESVSPLIATARLGVEFFPWERVGVWADYGMSRLDARIHSSRFDGAVEIYEGGLRVGVTWRFGGQ